MCAGTNILCCCQRPGHCDKERSRLWQLGADDQGTAALHSRTGWIQRKGHSPACLQATPLLRSHRAHELVGPACLATLLAAAKAGRTSDNIASLSDELAAASEGASPAALLLLATVQWHCQDHEAALLTLDDLALADVDDHTNARVKALAGWITLSQCRGAVGDRDDSSSDEEDDDLEGHEHEITEAASLFNTACDLQPSCLEVRCRPSAHARCNVSQQPVPAVSIHDHGKSQHSKPRFACRRS